MHSTPLFPKDLYINLYINDKGPCAGIDKGLAKRKELNLDLLDKVPQSFTIYIGKDVYAVTTSYFRGLFDASLKTIKTKEEFKKKYKLRGNTFQTSHLNGLIDLLYNSYSIK